MAETEDLANNVYDFRRMRTVRKVSKLGKFVFFALVGTIAGFVLEKTKDLSSSELPNLSIPTAQADISSDNSGCDSSSGSGSGTCF